MLPVDWLKPTPDQNYPPLPWDVSTDNPPDWSLVLVFNYSGLGVRKGVRVGMVGVVLHGRRLRRRHLEAERSEVRVGGVHKSVHHEARLISQRSM